MKLFDICKNIHWGALSRPGIIVERITPALDSYNYLVSVGDVFKTLGSGYMGQIALEGRGAGWDPAFFKKVIQ